MLYIVFHQKYKIIPDDIKLSFNSNEPNTFQDPLNIHHFERAYIQNPNQLKNHTNY